MLYNTIKYINAISFFLIDKFKMKHKQVDFSK